MSRRWMMLTAPWAPITAISADGQANTRSARMPRAFITRYAPVGLPGDHRDAGDGRLAERIQELGPVPDDPAVLLVHAREKPGHVDEREERDVEGVTEPDETRRLLGSGDVEGAGEHGGLVGDDSDAVAVETAQPDHDVLGPVLVDLEELAFVEDRLDDVLHVVGLGGRVGDAC